MFCFSIQEKENIIQTSQCFQKVLETKVEICDKKSFLNKTSKFSTLLHPSQWFRVSRVHTVDISQHSARLGVSINAESVSTVYITLVNGRGKFK